MRSARAILIACIIGTCHLAVGRQNESSDLFKLKFLAGAWGGTMDGGTVDEHWSEPAGDAMVGMFRWVGSNGKARLFEIITIKAEADGPAMRIRHFDGSFKPWAAETGDVPALKLTKTGTDRAVFTNTADTGLKAVEYSVARGEVTITLTFHDPKRQALKFQMKKKGG